MFFAIDMVKYKITINAIDHNPKSRRNTKLINKKTMRISFPLKPKFINFNENKGISDIIRIPINRINPTITHGLKINGIIELVP